MAKTSDAQIRANAKYDAANTKRFGIKLNLLTDADVIARLEQVSDWPGGKQGYIKALIRADMQK